MSDELIPVVLKFNNVAANANINFTFTTTGATWCLGADSGDSLGFSYGVLNAEDAPVSCIRKIEFNNSVLAITTSEAAPALNTFTLTLFLKLAQGVDFLQGYCTLNNEAWVKASFGSQRAVLWRNGRISAVLREGEPQYRRILFSFKGAHPGAKIALEVSTKKGLGEVNLCLGPDFSEAAGIGLSPAGSGLPLASLSYTSNSIIVETLASAQANGASMDFALQAYIIWEPPSLDYIYLKADCDSEISVYGQVGNRQPQSISQTFTLFTL
jgi:hypothetical protein